MMQYDVLIVGAGSAGAACAYRLGRRMPDLKIVLLEAGGRDWHPYIHVPAAIVKLIGSPKVDWGIQAKPDETRKDKVDLWPAGKVLGGSSSINGMLYVRGAPNDFDRWKSYGLDGWGYEDVLPYFKDLEDSAIGNSDIRGKDGPMAVNRLRSTHPLANVFVEAAAEAGLAFNADYNGNTQEGVSYSQATQIRGQRYSAARAFLWPGKKPANVDLVMGAHVQKLLFEGKTCIGAEVCVRGKVSRYQARETIVSTGALQTPKTLMLSGIGPASHLKEHGIDVVADLPGVGENLQDHPEGMVGIEVNQRTYNMEINSWRVGMHAVTWALLGRGPATSPYPHAVAFLKTDPKLEHPDIQVQLGPYAFSFDENGVVPFHKPAISAAVNVSYPKSRGQVRLSSADPAVKPAIEHKMFGAEEDLDLLIKGCQKVRTILNGKAFAAHRVAERLPGENIQAADEWRDYLRSTAFLGYHSAGTAKMGKAQDRSAVIGSDLCVKGVRGLRVADASIMPDLISGNTNATAMMIGLKAADLVAKDLKKAKAA